MSGILPIALALIGPLQANLQAIIATPTLTTLEAQGVQLAGEEVAAAVQAQPQLIAWAAQHLLSALDNAIAAAPTVTAAPPPSASTPVVNGTSAGASAAAGETSGKSGTV